MTTKYIQSCHEGVKKEVMGACDSGTVWIENRHRDAESFVGFLQKFSEETTTTVRSTTIVTYPMHVILLSESARRNQ